MILKVAGLLLLLATSFWVYKVHYENESAAPTCLTECCQTLNSRPKMTYIYYQNTGRLVGGSGEWAVNTRGYSGQGQGKNNPAMQCVVNTGPAPATTYTLSSCQNVMHGTTTRPCSFVLSPVNEAEMCGRTDIMLHGCNCCTSGDQSTPPVDGCSAGCVVINVQNRMKMRVGDTLIVRHTDPGLLLDQAQ